MDKVFKILRQSWDAAGWSEALMIVLPLIPLIAYIAFVLYARKVKFIDGTPSAADYVALFAYLLSLPVAVAVKLLFGIGPFVSLFGTWFLFLLIYYCIIRFMKYMSYRERRLIQQERIKRQEAIQRENRRKRGI